MLMEGDPTLTRNVSAWLRSGIFAKSPRAAQWRTGGALPHQNPINRLQACSSAKSAPVVHGSLSQQREMTSMPQDLDDPDLSLEAMFRRWPPTAAVFLEHAMLCVGCPISPFHTVIDACFEYGLDETAFRAELHRIATPSSCHRPYR